MRALETVGVTAEEIGFAGATQIGKLRTRVRGCGRHSKETRYLITSATQERLDALGLLDAKRGYWGIEAKLHHRLDEVLGEDQSRVRTGPAAHVLGMCRRVVVSFACEWLRRAKGGRKHSRKSTRDFQEHLEAHGATRAFTLITTANPTAWLPN